MLSPRKSASFGRGAGTGIGENGAGRGEYSICLSRALLGGFSVSRAFSITLKCDCGKSSGEGGEARDVVEVDVVEVDLGSVDEGT